jgi:hypothetical protein
VNEYFEGAIRQLQARARHLVSLIPRNLERDVDTLAIHCRDHINAVIARMENLLSALHVGRGGDPSSVPKRSPIEHPADAARMDVIWRALRRGNFSQDTTAVQSHWRQLLNTIRADEAAE